MRNPALQRAADRVAIGISAICALHCMLTPVALALLPVLVSTPLGDAGFHRAMLLLILPSSGVALTLGCRLHKDLLVMAAGGVGLAMLVLAAFLGHDLLGAGGERLLTLSGAATLSTGHVRNYLLCRKVSCTH